MHEPSRRFLAELRSGMNLLIARSGLIWTGSPAWIRSSEDEYDAWSGRSLRCNERLPESSVENGYRSGFDVRVEVPDQG